MERLDVGGRRLAVEERGAGDAVVLLHSGLLADSMRPLAEADRLARGRRLVAYHRRGYGHSAPADGPVSVAEQAGDTLALMDRLGVEAAHIVGHSVGGTIALEVALRAPERVRSLVLLEPLLLFALAPETAEFVAETAAVAFPRYEQGDRAGAVDAWLSGACGAGFRDTLERALPGAFEQAARDADAAFAVEVPSLESWPRRPDDLRQLAVPVLSIVSEGADWPGFRETHEALLAWLPRAEGATVPAKSHLLQLEQPSAVAGAICSFLERRTARSDPAPGAGRRSREPSA